MLRQQACVVTFAAANVETLFAGNFGQQRKKTGVFR
jgi:hypothetical protein